jgi:signal transduction histidine kinase
MQDLFSQSQVRLRPLIEESGAKFVVPAQWPVSCGYAPWVEGIWVQYISNALKYGGSPPHITVGATDNGNGTHTYFVQDAGPGIAVEKQQNLFEEFSRLEHARSGNGLGLSIVRRITTRLHGDAGVESEPGRGSRFYFTLPAALSADEREFSVSDSPDGNPRLSSAVEPDQRIPRTSTQGRGTLTDR